MILWSQGVARGEVCVHNPIMDNTNTPSARPEHHNLWCWLEGMPITWYEEHPPTATNPKPALYVEKGILGKGKRPHECLLDLNHQAAAGFLLQRLSETTQGVRVSSGDGWHVEYIKRDNAPGEVSKRKGRSLSYALYAAMTDAWGAL